MPVLFLEYVTLDNKKPKSHFVSSSFVFIAPGSLHFIILKQKFSFHQCDAIVSSLVKFISLQPMQTLSLRIIYSDPALGAIIFESYFMLRKESFDTCKK